MRYAPARARTPKSPVAASHQKMSTNKYPNAPLKCHYVETVKTNAQLKWKMSHCSFQWSSIYNVLSLFFLFLLYFFQGPFLFLAAYVYMYIFFILYIFLLSWHGSRAPGDFRACDMRIFWRNRALQRSSEPSQGILGKILYLQWDRVVTSHNYLERILFKLLLLCFFKFSGQRENY